MSQELLHVIFEKNAVKFAGKIAVKEDNASISYSQLNTFADKLAGTLLAAGLHRGDIVSVLMPSGIHWVTSMLGIFKAGLIYLPLSNAYPDKRIRDIYAHTKFKVLLVTPDSLPRAQALMNETDAPESAILVCRENGQLQWFNPDSRKKEAAETDNDRTEDIRSPQDLSSDDIGYIIYTSGTTGAGKAIAGCHKGLAHFINWQIREFAPGENCQVAQLASMVFDASFRDVFLPLSLGGTLHIADESTRQNAALLVQWLSDRAITLMHSVPSVWKLIMKQVEGEPAMAALLHRLQYIFLAGEPLYAKDIMKWRSLMGSQTEIINLYGTSETTMAKTFYRVNTLPVDPTQILPVGKPIDNTAIAIIYQNRLCRTGELGEIYIKTRYWTLGYYKDANLTRSVFVQNPLVTDREDIVYKTGDLGRYLEDQNIEVIGRVDDQVKVNGMRVELGEIEKAVLHVPGISETVIKTRQDAEGSNEIICYYTNKDITAESIRSFLRTELADSFIPSYYVYMSAFPLNINGKVDKKALPDPEEINGRTIGYEPPENPTEARMEKIWNEVLNKQQVGRNESFFMTGGNSLKAIRVISRISKEFKIQIKVAEIFNHQTISQLSSLIDRLTGGASEEIPLCPLREYYELSHAQKRLWTLCQLDQDSYAYHIPQAFLLEGPLDIDALRHSLEKVIDRHEILRTNFISLPGGPGQMVHPAGSLPSPLIVTDLSLVADQEAALKVLLRQSSVKPFDLSADRLLRAELYRLSETKHIFFLNIHHIITDEWSAEILFRELLEVYSAITTGKEVRLVPLKIQYKDFAHWHNERLRQPAYQEHQIYWLSQLNGNVRELALPQDFSRPELRTAAGGTVEVYLDRSVSRQLQELALKNNTGPYSLMLAAINVLFNQITGHEKIIVGSPWTCRTLQELEPQIGFYVNTLPLCVKTDPEETFLQLLNKVKEVVSQAGKYQDYPFDRLLEDMKLKRKANRSPIFDIGFTWHDDAHSLQKDLSFAVTPYKLDFTGVKADLWFHGSMEEDKMHLSLEYSKDIFRESTAQLLLDSLKNTLMSVAQRPEAAIRHVSAEVLKTPQIRGNTADVEFNF